MLDAAIALYLVGLISAGIMFNRANHAHPKATSAPQSDELARHSLMLRSLANWLEKDNVEQHKFTDVERLHDLERTYEEAIRATVKDVDSFKSGPSFKDEKIVRFDARRSATDFSRGKQ